MQHDAIGRTENPLRGLFALCLRSSGGESAYEGRGSVSLNLTRVHLYSCVSNIRKSFRYRANGLLSDLSTSKVRKNTSYSFLRTGQYASKLPSQKIKLRNNHINRSLHPPMSRSRTRAYLGVHPIPGVGRDVETLAIVIMKWTSSSRPCLVSIWTRHGKKYCSSC
jgi:hypothetical protein